MRDLTVNFSSLQPETFRDNKANLSVNNWPIASKLNTANVESSRWRYIYYLELRLVSKIMYI